MKLTKKTAGEIMQVHEAYWAEYLKGNVEAMAALLDSSYTQVGSAESEVFYTKKEAVQFLHDTIKEVAGKLEMRNRKTSQESQDGLVLVHEICDLYALDGKEWIFYSKFRATTLLREKKEGWKLIHQHSSFPDSKTDEGQNVAIDKIAEENRELREAVKRRTTELEHKNRELEIEASLERIRAQAMAMRESADLLDIVVTLRNEFIALGHEAHYFWHMRWLPEIYEKAMTSGDGTRIGMVMELPRHIHGDIPLLAKWEKGKKPTVIYAMDVEAALDYVDKMVTLGDFQQVDPNAPTEEDIRHIGGLTFVMARTTHGEIGYSLPGAVEQVPKEDLEILVRFAGAFDLAHKRFEDLKKSEQQAREVQVELALEKVRSRTMGMQESSELKEVVKVIFDQLAHLSINAEHAGIVVDYEPKKDFHFWVADNQDIPAKITVPYLDLVWDRQFTEAKKKGQGFFTTLLDFEEKNSFYKKLLPHIEGLTKQAQDFYFSCPGLAASTVIEKDIGLYIENFSGTPYSGEENDILRRFAKVFQQTYTRFLDLQKAEAQTREAQIEAALERVRSRSMAMHESGEMLDVIEVVSNQLKELKLNFDIVSFAKNKQEGDFTFWMTSRGQPKPILMEVPTMDSPVLKGVYNAKKTKTTFLADVFTPEENREWNAHLFKYSNLKNFPDAVKDYILNAPGFARSSFLLENIDLYVGNYRAIPFTEDENSIFKRFAQVFEQAYTRFLDLQKAEAQVREAQIEAALEKVRSRSLAMHKSDELKEVVAVVLEKLQELNIAMESRVAVIVVFKEGSTDFNQWVASPTDIANTYISTPYIEHIILSDFWKAKESGLDFYSKSYSKDEKNTYFKYFFENSFFENFEGIEDQKKWALEKEFYTYSPAFEKNSSLGIADFSGQPLSENEIVIIKRFAKVFEQAYIRFLDLQKAEAQSRESQIEAALERVRAKSMAMHKSEELAGLSLELVKQVQALGVKTWFCAFNIYDDDPQGSLEWGSNGQGTFPRYRTPREGVFLHYYDEGQKGETLLVNEIGGNECAAHYEYLCSLPGVGDQLLKMKDAGIPFPTSQIDHVAYFKYGYILFITYEPTPESHEIFIRFAKVFEQTYTRFLDLKKAEAQTREAQIEGALERVRSRSMAMHSSSELVEASDVMLAELKKLNIHALRIGICTIDKKTEAAEIWSRSEINGKVEKTILGVVPKGVHPIFDNMVKAWKEKQASFSSTRRGIEVKKYYEALSPHLSYPLPETYNEHEAISAFFFPEGSLNVVSIEALQKEEEEIMLRFANVFGQIYRRFLDLKKAEAQAREARIENALEKVRSRTMAMQKGEEVKEVVVLLYKELIALGVDNFVTCGYVEVKEKINRQYTWVTSPGGDSLGLFYLPLTGDATFDERYAAWKKQQSIFHQTVAGKVRSTHLEFAITTFNSKEAEEMVRNQFPDPCVFYCFNFSHGYLHLVTGSKLKEEEEALLARFTRVFEQTYARFLDLKKAEAQAREAQIEAALERARAQSMMMQHSDELNKTSEVFHDQLSLLGIDSEFSYLWLPDEEHNEHLFWATWQDNSGPSSTFKNKRVVYPLDKTEPSIAACYLAWESGNSPHVNSVPAEDVEAYFATWTELLDGVEKFKPKLFPDGLYYVDAYMKYGCFGIVIKRLLSDNEQQILRRFSKEFERAYTRFLDLQKAEVQARESQIEAALERVRSRTMGMQRSEELGEVATVLFKELNQLVDNLWTCGFVLCEKDREEDEWWLSDQNGFIPAFYLPNVGDEAHANIYNAWKNGADYHTEQLKGEPLQKHYEWLMNIPVAKKIFDDMRASGNEIPTWQKLHCAFFKTGYLVIITQVPCPEEDIFKRFAQVFDLTYTRFLDLQLKEEQAVKLAEEKERLEVTLSDLRATQTQLIQSEKMASLGELTAGIAHEIQNPLNFVNNFSEVSKELIEEMLEEMEKGDVEEVKALAKDIIQNLDKIHHHGQRADGIVKGMLQHSRTSSGEKEPTDLNVLADEYLRLAYHGLRAKDKSFNATLETHFDESIGKVNVLTQDMGRVILNLITNAFYVVQKKKEQQPEGYKPTVTVSTRKEGNKVQITVKDNGNGIPDAIKEKIFQPFFTTKPTGQGTGLGLSMSYDIITKGHGGELTVETKQGEGSVFIISIKNE